MNIGEEKLIPTDGYTDDVKSDGSKFYTCKQCEKEIKSEQGIKMHMRSMHKNQAFKRTASSDNDQEENKKTRFGSMMNDVHFL